MTTKTFTSAKTAGKPLLVWCVIALAITIPCRATRAQAFINDNDGLLDVGEAADFPRDPADFSMDGRTLLFSNHGIEDLDGLSLLSDALEIELRNNHISSIESGDFDGLSALRVLLLQHNMIAHIEPNGFRGATNLQTLQFEDNLLAEFDPESFAGLGNLRSLELSRNAIASLRAGDFTEFPNLQSLDLSSNAITSIPPAVFSGLSNLRSIELSRNLINAVPVELIQGLGNLQSLDLSRNPISHLESGFFANADSLKHLLLLGTDLTTLNLAGGSFSSLNSCGFAFVNFGFCVDKEEITSLILDDAKLSQESFDVLVAETGFITDISLVGMTFTDLGSNDLNGLLKIPSLDHVRLDTTLYRHFAPELDAFAAVPGNTVTIVPESTCILFLPAVIPFFSARRRSLRESTHSSPSVGT